MQVVFLVGFSLVQPRFCTCCCPVFRSESFIDCSLTAHPSATTMSDVQYLDEVTFDREQNSVDMRSAAVKELAHFNW